MQRAIGMLKLLILISLITPIALCAEIDQLINNLGAENFDQRENASEELSTYSSGYCSIFLKLSETSNDPEIAWRLKRVSHEIFKRQIFTKDERWKRLHGTLGIEINRICSSDDSESRERDREIERERTYEEQTTIGYRIEFVQMDGPATTILKQSDVIIEINGKKVTDVEQEQYNDYGFIKPNQQYSLKLIRHKEPQPDADGNMPPEENPFVGDETTVIIQSSIHKEVTEREDKLLEALWNEYLTNRKDGAQ